MNNSKNTCWIILHPPLGEKQKAKLRRRKRSWSASSTENRERRVGLEGSRIESHETSRLVVVFSWRFVDFGMRCLDLPTYIWHTHYAGKGSQSHRHTKCLPECNFIKLKMPLLSLPLDIYMFFGSRYINFIRLDRENCLWLIFSN